MDLKYPIGPYQKPSIYSVELVRNWGKELGYFPENIKNTISGWDKEKLQTKTLPGVWTVASVIHHLADSHSNSLTRMKLTLTENTPTIKPYDESAWANLKDSMDPEITPSLKILEGTHSKMKLLSESINENDLERQYFHPESKTHGTLSGLFSMYVWHGNHHLAHIKLLKEKMGW